MTMIKTDKCGQCGWQGEANNALSARELLEDHLSRAHNIQGRTTDISSGMSSDIPGQSQTPRLNPNE